MYTAKLTVYQDWVLGRIDPRLYGSFIEHLGRAVYSGIYEPKHVEADRRGFRKDVIGLVQELGVTIVRYPGGNFVSGYTWTDGIGPRRKRPVRLDLAWKATESNEFGIDEFADWCTAAKTEGMIVVNLGTGSAATAGHQIEYCNHPQGSYWSDLRRKNGHKMQYGFKVWCLGNELDGPWQIGQLSADDYGKKARETAKVMRRVDPSIELVACGSSGRGMPTFPEWDRIVLEHTYEQVDYLSLHSYYGDKNGPESLLYSYVDLTEYIEAVIATVDYVKAKVRSPKILYLAVDEWNIGYQHMDKAHEPWVAAPPRLEQAYALGDALVVGGLLCALANHSDRVRIACMAQLVNAIAPILTKPGGGVLKQPTFYPFHQFSRFARGDILSTVLKAPMQETEKYGKQKILTSCANYDKDAGELTVFVLNCHQSDEVQLEIALHSFDRKSLLVEHLVMGGKNLRATNTYDKPDAVVPIKVAVQQPASKSHEVIIPRLSWNCLRFKIA